MEGVLSVNLDDPPSLFNPFNTSLNEENDTAIFNNTVTSGPKLTDDPEENQYLEMAVVGATSVTLGGMIMITIIGNVFVIAAILLEKNLQHVANYLIVSLAVADLMVACLVMPLGAVYVISRGWILGAELCDMWTSCDVLCCTASILHLVVIALDRYWAVTDMNYVTTRSVKKVCVMIGCVWAIALTVSLAPQFGWKDPDFEKRIRERKCLVSQDFSYQIFATLSTFYVPLVIILILYWRIFQTARMRIRKTRRSDYPQSSGDVDLEAGNRRRRFRHRFRRHRRGRRSGANGGPEGEQETAFTIGAGSGGNSNVDVEAGRRRARQVDPVRAQRERRESLEAKRERKAAKTLAIITGAFVICWLPFFLTALLTPVFGPVSDHFSNFILWLGYFNSTLNPVIYTIFSPDFRQAFQRILFGKRKRRGRGGRRR